MATVTISLPKSLKEFVDLQVASKGYGDASEYLCSLPREAQQAEADARLEALLLEGLASGDPIPVDEQFWSDLRAKTERRARGPKNRGEAGKKGKGTLKSPAPPPKPGWKCNAPAAPTHPGAQSAPPLQR